MLRRIVWSLTRIFHFAFLYQPLLDGHNFINGPILSHKLFWFFDFRQQKLMWVKSIFFAVVISELLLFNSMLYYSSSRIYFYFYGNTKLKNKPRIPKGWFETKKGWEPPFYCITVFLQGLIPPSKKALVHSVGQ